MHQPTTVPDEAAVGKACAGTDASDAHEIGPAALPRPDIGCDERATTSRSSGETTFAAVLEARRA